MSGISTLRLLSKIFIFRFLLSGGLFIVCTFQIFAADLKVVLTGNTADFKDPNQLFQVMEQYNMANPTAVLWVLNGDIFPESFKDEQITAWKIKANDILNRFPNLQILLNQGDRDWQNSGKNGWAKIQSLEKILQQSKHPRFQVFLENGCPGPWTFSLPSLEVIIINSQWWNHPYDKPIPASDVCTITDTDNFIEEFEGTLDEVTNKNVMILSHFPLKSMGNYGGRFPASAYLFPPLIGSAKVAYRQNVGTSKDISNVNFDAFRSKLNNVLHDYSSLIFASGHERDQSIMKMDQNYYINSGALASTDFVAKNKQAQLASANTGFIEITYQENGAVNYQHYQLRNNLLEKSETGTLLHSACDEPNSTMKNTLYQPCKDAVLPSQKMEVSDRGTIKISAGEEYESSKFKEKWFGRHYRRSWTEPVEAPYLNLDNTFKGLVINGKGGGRQTTSLKLVAGNGKEYVFRSVDKDPFRALGYELRGTIVAQVLKDQTSTQQPYAAMTTSYLLDKIKILHAEPVLYVLPKDNKLGAFKNDYGNLFGMLEERPTDKIDKDKIFAGAKDIEKSYKMFEKLYRDPDNQVDQREFGRARMFDLWIGDWSKHEDNWKWAGYKTKDGEIFRPIPRDRDHAFSRWDGIIPWLADREWAMPNGGNFGEHIDGLRSLMWQARHLDRFVASELTKTDWINAAKEIQNAITEKDIEVAIRKMPSEIYDKDGKEIELKLKSRIKDLPKYAEQYYLLLAKEVDVVGSNKAEYFQVNRIENGSVEVIVYDLNKKNQQPDLSKIYYHRTFDPKETKEIRLFGLLENDVFDIKGESEKSILVRVISGGGTDQIVDHSKVKGGNKLTLIYEKDIDTKLNLGVEAKNIKPKNESLYEYNRNAFAYNTYLPIALITYNSFTGLAIQGGVTFTRQSFSKPDFSIKHFLKASVSAKGNYEFVYGNQFRELAGKWDGISEIIVSRPLNYNYFFGIGNDTQKDTEKASNYYRTQYNSASVSAGLTRQFWKRSRIDLTANYEMAEGIKRENSYLADHPDVLGTEEINLVFAKGIFNLDLRDRIALPERGFHVQLIQQIGHVSKTENKIASISELEIEQYLSTYSKNPLTFGLRLGGGVTKGQLPFYKLLSLGQLNDLNGYKRNRFTGESKAFLNTELRYQLTQTRNTFVPLKIGIRGFYDLGRVWAESDASSANYWHQGYGAGFYITPFREQFAFNISAGTSKEESLLLMISVGSFFR